MDNSPYINEFHGMTLNRKNIFHSTPQVSEVGYEPREQNGGSMLSKMNSCKNRILSVRLIISLYFNSIFGIGIPSERISIYFIKRHTGKQMKACGLS